MNFDPQTA